MLLAEVNLKLKSLVPACLLTLVLGVPFTWAQQADIPKNLADSVGYTLKFTEQQFINVAEAMPEEKYGFIPTAGEFKGARSFAEQVKHVACANYGFFNQIEGKTPPEHCEKGGPSPAKTKSELLKYLRDSFAYGDRILSTINARNALDRVEGPYAGPNTRLGMAVTAVWHVTDHYGQIVEYLRMNGIVPPATQQYGLQVR
jgi:uncharacterized damage-inducible protein DinB